LKKVVKLRIEDLVYQGIKNGKIVDGKIIGEYSIMATWADDFIQIFETKQKCKTIICNNALLGKEYCDYIWQNFFSYINLRNEDVISFMDTILVNKSGWNKNMYNYVRRFISDKTDSLYKHYQTKIISYEIKNVNSKDWIPEIFIPF